MKSARVFSSIVRQGSNRASALEGIDATAPEQRFPFYFYLFKNMNIQRNTFSKLVYENSSLERVRVNNDGVLEAIFRVHVHKRMCNILDTVHGGCINTICDEFSHLTTIVHNKTKKLMITPQMNTVYLGAGRLHETVYVKAACIRVGKSLAFAKSEIYREKDENSKEILAKSDSIYQILDDNLWDRVFDSLNRDKLQVYEEGDDDMKEALSGLWDLKETQ
mmetsp:Transcript_28695/g.32790  ORF Transcript_28695/g.32790 Transcript_28695/m.32790 type:complete len:220 (-) Transcript_28695:107-766(-)